MNLPTQYQWLANLKGKPNTIKYALKEFGVKEVVGKGSNATIIAWRDELNLAGAKVVGFSDDDIPWSKEDQALAQSSIHVSIFHAWCSSFFHIFCMPQINKGLPQRLQSALCFFYLILGRFCQTTYSFLACNLRHYFHDLKLFLLAVHPCHPKNWRSCPTIESKHVYRAPHNLDTLSYALHSTVFSFQPNSSLLACLSCRE